MKIRIKHPTRFATIMLLVGLTAFFIAILLSVQPVLGVEARQPVSYVAIPKASTAPVATTEPTQEVPAEIDLLHRIVEAEAEGEPFEGKVAVASVVLNRVQAEGFPDTIHEVVHQPRQFQPVANGRINRVEPSEGTIEAVALVLEEGTQTDALYFMNPDLSDTGARRWMESLQYVGAIGNHAFYQ